MTGTGVQPAYAEFAVQSNFSFLRGASAPEELVVTSSRLGLAAMGLADRNTVAGVVRAWKMAQEARLPYHPGARLVFADGTPDILAYPRNRAGWAHLCRLLTQANFREESVKGAPIVLAKDIFEWGDELSLAVLPSLAEQTIAEQAFVTGLRQRFGETVWLAVAPRHDGNDRFRLEQAAAMARAAGVPLLAVNEVLYHAAERRPLQDVATAIRLCVPVADAGFELGANAERHLKPAAEMARLFRRHPEALAETLRFAATLGFSLKELEYNYPDEPTASGLPPQAELERLTWEGARHRFPGGVSERVEKIIRHELGIIEQLNYARYFLTVHDIMQFARSQKILCQGRGSAANSLVCFCLRITDVGPDVMDVLFERFISIERNEPPDIDVDFEHDRRDEVIAYIYEKYSEKRTALAASVVTYRGRSAVREVAKAMGLSNDVMTALSGSIWGWSTSELGEREAGAAGLDGATARLVLDRANEIMGFPRHLSQHTGGFVITRDRLDEIVPIVKTAMDERKMVEWDKDDLDAVKILKVDILALGMLSCLRRAFSLLENHYDDDDGVRDGYGRPLDLATIQDEDPRVYDMICRADTLGVFQIESRAQMSMLPRLRPREFYDLVIEVAIVRPGPIQGDMVHPYLRRRQGKEQVQYHGKELEKILGRTLGVPLFQEQAMKIAIVAGGFRPGEADELRRAMATFKRTGTIGNYRQRMVEGMVARNYPREFAERCFKQIEGFGEYGFPESHAASFSLLVYASCWFKAFYPDVFCAAILNSQPMGFYAPAQIVRDAQEHGVEIHEADINISDWDNTLEPGLDENVGVITRIHPRHAEMTRDIRTTHAMRLGFRQVSGVKEEDGRKIVEHRGQGYDSVRDLWLRTGIEPAALERLADADAFRSLGLDRREALWAVRGLRRSGDKDDLPLLTFSTTREHEPDFALPTMPLGEHVVEDYRHLHLSLKAHPVTFLRNELRARGIVANETLPSIPPNRIVTVSGLVLVRQRPGTASGVIFMTLEDETSIANIVVWPKVFEEFRPVVLGARFACVRGQLQSESNVIHVIADEIIDMTPLLDRLHADPSPVESLARADEIKHPPPARGTHPGAKRAELHKHPRNVRPLQPVREYDAETAAQKIHAVMPKGRNFH